MRFRIRGRAVLKLVNSNDVKIPAGSVSKACRHSVVKVPRCESRRAATDTSSRISSKTLWLQAVTVVN